MRLLVLLLLGIVSSSPTRATGCVPFSPTRNDYPGLFDPIIALPGDFNEDGTTDLAVVSGQIPGDITVGSVTLMLGNPNGNYTPGSTKQIGGSPQSASLADLNGDGHVDVVVAHYLDENLSLIFGDGTGGSLSTSIFPLPESPSAVIAEDFTGDGETDLLVATTPLSFPGTVHVYRGAGDGSFTPLDTAATGVDPRAVALDEFTGDGIRDIAVGNRGGQSVTIIPGTGGGYLGTPVETPIFASINSLRAADFNNDQNVDLVAGGDTVASSVVALIGDGSGGFTPMPGIPLGTGIPSVSVCDFDRDGFADVVAAKFAQDALSVLRGRGDGTFEPPEDLGANARPKFIHSSDLDKDGFCDTVSSNQAAGSLSVFLADGFGNLGTPSFPVGTTPLGVAAADLDGDGRPDLVTADRDSDTVSILFGDGDGGFTPGLSLSAGPAPGAVAIADLNDDGAPDIAVANQGPPGSPQSSDVIIFEGDGLGAFPTQTTLGVGKLPLDILAVDLNADGRADLAVANGDSDTVSVYKSVAGGGFDNGHNYRTGTQPRALAALDVDDAIGVDLAVSLGGDNVIGFLLATANGGFTEYAQTLPGPGFNVDDLTAADINGDGREDLLWINQTFIDEPSTISIFLSDGGSWFVEAPSSGLATTTFAEAIEMLDLNRTGGIDMVVTNRFNDSVRVYDGDGAGGFIPKGDFGTGRQPFALAVTDLNQDGREDVATADFAGNSVSVLLNNTFIPSTFTSLYTVDGEFYMWDPIPGAALYRVYRGFSTILRDKDYGSCFLNNAATVFKDSATPPSGKAWFYLVTPVINGIEGHMDFTSSCHKRINRNPCPFP